MCLALPGRIIAIDGETALVDYDGIKKEANISLIECEVGDFVLVHVGFAIQKVDEDSARQTYSLLDEADRRLSADGPKDGGGQDD
ncbi:TPA: HypC/HybG/HupF family hydrogenase formation chaperone [Candidatus Woesearchaeota archaeon]|nr:HypC/HybG/HupF family hydrogenase formation chaperone [Candidatus Woesearchaeota archaeon]